MIPSTVSNFRQHHREQQFSKYYSGLLHFGFINAFGITGILMSLLAIQDVSGKELLVVPITFLYANLVEYLAHKGPMHHKKRFLSLIFRRHTLEHHHFFTHESMSYEGTQDYKMVLFPPILIVFFFGFFALPVGFLLYYYLSANTGYLFVLTALGYYLNYEWLHFCYHLREDSWAGKLPFMARLRQHHTVHHDTRLMNRYHFNITYPFCDYLFGTFHTPNQENRIPDESPL
ncbi:MAG: fatty acid hydroxylase family protein [Planctomycetota bacterium]